MAKFFPRGAVDGHVLITSRRFPTTCCLLFDSLWRCRCSFPEIDHRVSLDCFSAAEVVECVSLAVSAVRPFIACVAVTRLPCARCWRPRTSEVVRGCFGPCCWEPIVRSSWAPAAGACNGCWVCSHPTVIDWVAAKLGQQWVVFGQ